MVHTKGKHHKILCNTCHPISYILIVKDTDVESIYFNCEMGNEYTGPRLFCLHWKFVEIILHGRVGCLVFSLLYPDRFDQNRVTNQSCQIIRVCECCFYWKYCVAYNVSIEQVTNQIVLHYVTCLVQMCWHSLSLLVLFYCYLL